MTTKPAERVRGPRQLHNPQWVLILDDDVAGGRALGRWIQKTTGLQVRIARTTHQAHCWLATLPEPAAVLSDFELQHGENGVLALQTMRAQGCRAPAALVTGAPDLAIYSLASSTLDEVVPVFCRSKLHQLVSDWLEQLCLCWSAPRLATG